MEQSLVNQVALVAGGTRGAGRGIATELGAAGATVYVTGRTTRTQRSPMNRPETIEKTAELVSAAGGHGIAVPVDHGDPDQVDGLLARIEREHGGQLDILVNELRGRRIAAIAHDPSLADEPQLVRAAGAAAALALENQRLSAELRANIDELRASRARLVEAGDSERRRLERDLHDGAQSRLVALAGKLRLARVKSSDQPEVEAILDESSAELQASLDELRELARGIHPAVLNDRGLDAALESLASRAPLPVQIAGEPPGVLPPTVTTAIYFVVSEALTNVAKYARASSATVAVRRAADTVVVEVCDDGVGGADIARGSGLRGLSDRVAALDGRLELDSQPGQGTQVRAEIPIAPA